MNVRTKEGGENLSYYYPWYWQRPNFQPYPAMTLYQSMYPNYQYPTQYYPQLPQGYCPQRQLGLGTDRAGIFGFGAPRWYALRGLLDY